jgi:hypothetical protein
VPINPGPARAAARPGRVLGPLRWREPAPGLRIPRTWLLLAAPGCLPLWLPLARPLALPLPPLPRTVQLKAEKAKMKVKKRPAVGCRPISQ